MTGEQEAELPVSIGDVPDDVDAIDFTALQTYDDGDVVRWIDPTPENGEEPEHPAPVLTVRGDASGHDDGEEAGHDDGDSHDDSSSGVIIAIVIGVVVVLGVLAFVLSRSRRNAGSRQD